MNGPAHSHAASESTPSIPMGSSTRDADSSTAASLPSVWFGNLSFAVFNLEIARQFGDPHRGLSPNEEINYDMSCDI